MKKRNLFSRNLLPIMRRSNNSLLYRMCHIMNLLEDLRRLERSTISDDYDVYVSEEIQMEGDPTSFEEAIRSAHSSKWLEAMEDEMKFMSTNRVWDLEKISKGAKIVGCKWVYKTKCDSKGNIKRFKA
jgi:flagellar motor switch protein FliG